MPKSYTQGLTTGLLFGQTLAYIFSEHYWAALAATLFGVGAVLYDRRRRWYADAE